MSNLLEAKATHVFQNSAEKVFDAWLDPELVGQWMFGPEIRDETVVSIDIDPRVGGAFSFLVQRQSLVVDHIGTYAVIDRPKQLEFNWGVKGMSDNSRVVVTIAPHDSGCELSLVHYLHPDWAAYFQRSVEGWKNMLVILDKVLERKKKQ